MVSENNLRDNRIISIFSIVFCSIGVLSNIVSIFISLRKELRRVPTFVFFAFLSVINILKLISIGLFAFILEFQIQNEEELNERVINVGLFIIFLEYQSTPYFKVKINNKEIFLKSNSTSK